MKREGTLEETPLPILFYEILKDERSCTLELKLRQLEKRIVFEDGTPVSCASNLLHETLGKYLVERGKLTEQQYQSALAESVSTGKQMGELLVSKQLIAPFDLYKQLQANLAHKILDCFRWTDAKWRILSEGEPSQSALRMNTAQLILTGTSNFLPFDVVATQFAFTDEQRFAAVHSPPEFSKELKLSGKDARFFQALRSRPTFNEVMQQTGLDLEPALRKLYALVVLGLVDVAENVSAMEPDARPRQARPESAAPVAEAPSITGVPFADEDAEVKDALMREFLDHRTKDPFALLGIEENAAAGVLKKAFLDRAERFSPLRFHSGELKEKAELLLMSYARAFAALADPEQAAAWKKRRAAAEEKRRSEVKPSTAEQFRIRTDLLDARSQFEAGRERLGSGNARGALEYFEYACDIDPKPMHRAWRAWARFNVDPDVWAKLALQELNEALKVPDGVTDEAFAFAAEIHRKFGNWADAEAMYRKAFKLNPANRSYPEAIQQVMKMQKRG